VQTYEEQHGQVLFFPTQYRLPQEAGQVRELLREGTGMVFKVSSVDQGLGIYFAWSELEMNRILLDAPKVDVVQPIVEPLLVAPLWCLPGVNCGKVYKFNLRLNVVVTSQNPLRVYVNPTAAAVTLCPKPYGRSSDPTVMACGVMELARSPLATPAQPGSVNSTYGFSYEDTPFLTTWPNIDLGISEAEREALERRIERAAAHAFVAGAGHNVIRTGRKNMAFPWTCYELFGLDFLVDKELNPTIVEINAAPQIDMKFPSLLPREKMVEDMLCLLGLSERCRSDALRGYDAVAVYDAEIAQPQESWKMVYPTADTLDLGGKMESLETEELHAHVRRMATKKQD